MFNKNIKPVLIKLEGKESLSGRYLRSGSFLISQVGMGTVSGWLSYLVVFRSEVNADLKLLSLFLILIISIISFLCFSLIGQGEEAWHCCLSNNREPSFRHTVFWLMPSRWLKSFVLNLVLSVKKMFWIFLFLLPGNVLIFLSYFLSVSQEKALSLISFFGGSISLLIGFLFAFTINQRYFLSKYLVAKHPNKHIKDALRESINLMNGICLKTAIFKLSFFPHFVICLTGFPAIFIAPYFRQSCMVLKREIIESSFSQKLSE